jgi:hypothetical protein
MNAMRTVRDNRGVTWICLELPEVPAEQVAAAAAAGSEVVAVECNSGAERVIALLEPEWADTLDDASLTALLMREIS